jgi:hypothetical protein
MKLSRILTVLTVATTVWFAACGGGSSSSVVTPPPTTSQNGSVGVTISDDSSDDWATIGVKILDISLVPQGGGANVTVYTAPATPPSLNLVQLDQLGEVLGNASVPTGTYTGAVVTISANAGDVSLVAANDPTAGFAGTAGAAVPSGQIQIQGTSGSAGSKTVQVNVQFKQPLVVTTGGSNLVNLEFDLGHPAFIVDHETATGNTFWAVNFNGPVRHRFIADLRRILLRHIYGSVASVASDNSNFTITRVFPARPITTPETAVTTSNSLAIYADSTNGTLFYDVDAKTKAVVKDFSSVASVLTAGKFVRVAARYQQNGTLVAVRVWVSSSFNSVWISPEGHVLHVNKSTNTLVIANEDGRAVPVVVDNNTQFFFRTPQNALADATPISTGTGLVQNGDIVRGFKVHVSVVDPLASTLVAQTVDIEIAKYDGRISAPNLTSFVYTRDYVTNSDDYTVNIPYIADATANGTDANGVAISGFKWWNFTFPTLVDSGTNAKSDFVAATSGSANFGGTVGSVATWGVSYMAWNDPAKANDWSSMWTVLRPMPIPRGTVGTPWLGGTNGGSFGLNVAGGTNTVTVSLSSVSGSATLVYQVDRTGLVVTVSPQDLTTSAGLNNVASHLVAGTPVKVFGVPQADGTIKAYAVFYYTGMMPTMN